MPDEIMWAPAAVRLAYWHGYYDGDGAKEPPPGATYRGQIRCTNKGKIGAAGLFVLMRSLGYGVSVSVPNRYPGHVTLYGSRSLPHGRSRFDVDVVKKVRPVPTDPSASYVYHLVIDGASSFTVGVGCLLVPSAAPRCRSAGNHKRSRHTTDDSNVV